MKTRYWLIMAFAFVIFNANAAGDSLTSQALKKSRNQVVKQYINDLQKADYQDISSLFLENGIVISTSKGTMNAKEFFYSFLPNIVTAKTQTHQLLMSTQDINHQAARFRFAFTMNDAESSDGEYVDEFVFADNSAKLSAVFMFENLKFPHSPFSDQ